MSFSPKGAIAENLSGQIVKGYELLERIGTGAYGAVYRTFQSTIGREVALKVILPAHAGNPEFIRRFEFEAQIIARLEHLHVVPLYDYWRDPSGAYLAMRWLRGGSLLEALRRRPLTPSELAAILDQVGDALAAAHQKGVVHRDLKPSNILLDEEGNAYVADFGIALDLGRASGKVDEEGSPVGSAAYLSPEQARRELATPQSDIYSLGICVYEALAGAHPFAGSNPVDLLYRHLNDPIPPAEDLPENLRGPVNEFIRKATAKNPGERFQDLPAMMSAFHEAVQVEGPPGPQELTEGLTPREREILSRIAEGRTNKEIAGDLFVELSTVKWYITQIYRKLDVRSRTQAILRAREMKPFLLDMGPGREGEAAAVSLAGSPLRNPYKGLRSFEAADAADFYGREALVSSLLGRLAEHDHLSRFLAVVGPSGSGKSSLINAGLIPALRQGGLPGSGRWFIVDLTPGPRPLDALEVALTRVAADQSDNLRRHLERDSNGLSRAVSLILPKDGSEVLIVIDQFEEVFTLVDDEDRRGRFLSLLGSSVTDPRSRVRVLIAMRADSYHRPLEYAEFGELVRRRLETILPLHAEELEQAILEPASRAGATFEAGLVTRIIDDVRYRPGALPSLQYALTELFDNRRGTMLTREAYDGMGGAAGALAYRAEELYAEQAPEGREAMRRLFLRLVTLEEGDPESQTVRAARSRVPRSDLLELAPDPELMDELLDTLTNFRLLTADYDPRTRRPTVELAHEAIFGNWDRLGAWLEESREDMLQHRRLRALVTDWEQAGGSPEYLLRGGRLDQFAGWAEVMELPLGRKERAYLDESLDAREARRDEAFQRQQQELDTARRLAESERRRADEQTHAAGRLRRRAVYLAAALTLGLVFAASALLYAREAEAQRRISFARELAASAAASLESDPELSLLLALQAAHQTYPHTGSVPAEVEDSLHRALQASRTVLALPQGGAVAYSPDGSVIATGGDDGTVRLWDLSSGAARLSIEAHRQPVTGLAFAPDGKTLASVSLDGDLKLLDVERGTGLLTLSAGLGNLTGVDISTGGEIVTAAGEFGVGVWTLPGGEPLTVYTEHRDLVSGVALSSSGEFALTYSPSGLALAWDTRTGETLARFEGNSQPFLSGIDISPGGDLVAVSDDAGVTLWTFPDGVAVRTLPHSAPVVEVAFDPQDRWLASSSEDGSVQISDLNSGHELLQLHLPEGPARSLAFRPDGDQLAASTAGGSTRLFDLRPEASREWLTLSLSSPVDSVVYSADGKRLAITPEGRNEFVVDAENGEMVFETQSQATVFGRSAFSPDGRTLAVPDGHAVALYDLESGTLAAKLEGHTGNVSALAFSPDGSLLASSDDTGVAILWDAATDEQLHALHSHTDWVVGLAFSPNGARLATASWDRTAALWDAASGALIRILRGHSFEVWGVAFSPDGKRIATAAWDSTAVIWDAAGGEPLRTLRGHNGNLTDVAFSPDGSVLATVSFDAEVILWDSASGAQLLTLGGNQAPITSVDFSPDGHRLVTGNIDGSVRVYALDVADLLQLARERVTRSLTQDECARYLHAPACPEAP